MTAVRRLVVELELVVREQQSIEGRARAPGLPPHEFSGWSELFATLQTMVHGSSNEAGGGSSAGEMDPGR